ncbi:MAG TPA: PH domain-containing protein [Allosphingosinicella sp.]|nr:PH domain-containing protein [Allosphingosinicella sp.]
MSAELAGPRRLHPISVVGSSLKQLPGAVIGMIGAFTVLVQRNPVLAVLIAVGLLLVMLAGAFLRWWRFTYEVREREIVIQQGLLSRQRRVIPFDRVRDIAIERPLLARLVGTAKVRIETGGGKGDEGLLDMIELATAHTLRDSIRRSNVLAPAAATADQAAAPEGAPTEPVIFAMSLGRVLGSGLFNFSLIFIALAFGALQYLEDLGIIDFERFARSGEARSFTGMFTFRTGLIILSLLVLLGVVSGVLRTLARDHGFRLTIGPTGLRRRRGLFTLSEILIPARRTEAAVIEVGPLAGWLGWQGLAFQTLGADPKEGGVQVAAPFARPEEIERVLQAAGFPLPPETKLIRPPKRALVRRCGPPLVLAALIGGAGAVWPEAWWGLAVPLVIVAAGYLTWRRAGHLVGEEALFVCGGLLTRKLWIVPYEKLQTLSTSRSLLQRALKLASLAPDTAGAALFGAPEVEDLPEHSAEALAARLLARFYDARLRVREAAIAGH